VTLNQQRREGPACDG